MALAVSGGLFADKYHPAAWVLEGSSSVGRIIERFIAPRGENDCLQYRNTEVH
jgi:hypothetical protein